MLDLLLLLFAAQPDADSSRGTEIRVIASSAPEEVERPPELRIDGKPQKWTESTGRTWVHRTRLKGLHTLELREPLGAEDDGAPAESFVAPLGDGVKILWKAWAPTASGPAGPRCLYVDAPDSESSKWRLCDADQGLPMRNVIDLSARGTCPLPLMAMPAFYLGRTGANIADPSFILFFDTLPGLYRAQFRDDRIEITFVPGMEACRNLAKGAPWVDLYRWRYPPASPDGGSPE